MTVAISEQSQNDPRAELFDPDADCSTDESIGGDPDARCALVDEERCSLVCHIRFLNDEPQDNDRLVGQAVTKTAALPEDHDCTPACPAPCPLDDEDPRGWQG